jgi:hypothetical protein
MSALIRLHIPHPKQAKKQVRKMRRAARRSIPVRG